MIYTTIKGKAENNRLFFVLTPVNGVYTYRDLKELFKGVEISLGGIF